MQITHTVCDVCGKPHRNMRRFQGKLIGGLHCWGKFWESEWLHWEERKYRNKQRDEAISDSNAIRFQFDEENGLSREVDLRWLMSIKGINGEK